MRRQLRSTSIKKVKVKTPSGIKLHFHRKKPSHKKCGSCGNKIVRKRLRPSELSKLTKVQKRPERPLPHMCAKCMREQIKSEVREEGNNKINKSIKQTNSKQYNN